MHLVNSLVFPVKEGEVLWRRGIKTKKNPKEEQQQQQATPKPP